jgi:hypothetical protein
MRRRFSEIKVFRKVARQRALKYFSRARILAAQFNARLLSSTDRSGCLARKLSQISLSTHLLSLIDELWFAFSSLRLESRICFYARNALTPEGNSKDISLLVRLVGMPYSGLVLTLSRTDTRGISATRSRSRQNF